MVQAESTEDAGAQRGEVVGSNEEKGSTDVSSAEYTEIAGVQSHVAVNEECTDARHKGSALSRPAHCIVIICIHRHCMHPQGYDDGEVAEM